MRRLNLCFLFTAILLAFGAHAQPKSPHVIFVNPGHESANPTGNFWSKVSLFTQAAAEDLNINLSIYYAQRDHFYMRQLVKRALRENPDYLILVNEKSVGLSLMKLVDNSKTKVFFLLNDLSKEERESLSATEQSMLIGGVEPNNYRAGFIQAKRLLDAEFLGRDHQYRLLALLGDHATKAAIDRKQGLMDALEASGVAYQLLDTMVANWSYELGFTLVNAVLKRNLEVDLIWSANDAIAFGAQKAARIHERRVLIGGVNWDKSPQAPLYVSMGGHVALGGLAMVYIHDYHLGQKGGAKHWIADIFVEDSASFSSAFIELIEQQQVGKIDFARFSQLNAPQLRFSVENLVITSQ